MSFAKAYQFSQRKLRLITSIFKLIDSGQTYNMLTENLLSPASTVSIDEDKLFFSNEEFENNFIDDQEYFWQQNRNWKPTILEEALAYREENPQEWKNRQRKIKKDFQESYQRFEENPFLDQYHLKLDKIGQAKKCLKNLIKTEPPSLQIQMKCEFCSKRHGKKNHNPTNNFKENVENDQLTIFEKKRDRHLHTKFNAARSRIEELDKVQFHIRVSKGRNLGNALADDIPRLLECQIRCKFHIGDNTTHTWKSDYEFCDVRGVAKWNHVFAIKGYTSMELSRSYITLEVVAKNRDGKIIIGETLLAGKNALINEDNTGVTRLPTENENRYWQEAFYRPGKIVCIASKLDHRVQNGFGEALTSLLTKEATNDALQNVNFIGFNGKKRHIDLATMTSPNFVLA